MRSITKNANFYFLILTFTFLLLGQNGFAQTCSPAPVGLVSWWQGDDNTLDSRSRNNGTLQIGATFVSGNVGQGFLFDGANGVVATPNSTLNNAFPTISIEGWVNPATHGTDVSGIFGKTIVANTNGDGFALRLLNGVIQSDLRLTGGDARTTFGTALPLNTWSHVALTYDGTNVRAFLNGVQVGSNFPASGTVKNTANSGICLFIGGDPSPVCTADPGFGFNGGIDELSIYDRAITSAEISSIFIAGSAGKSKPTATVAPSGQVGWWSGDGNANDIAGANNGTLQSGAIQIIGKAGQGFSFDGANAVLATPNSTLNNAFPTISIEGWVNPATHGTDVSGMFGKTIVANTSGDGFALRLLNGVIQSDLRLTGGDARTIFGTALPLNTWSHVALTYDGANVRAFLNGVQVGSNFPASGPVKNTANSGICLFIGGDPSPACTADTGFGFDGGIDELSIYNRAITPAEVTSIFNAGIAGKLKDNTTATGSNVAVSTKSDATVTFPTVTTAGITQQIPLNLSTLPSLPLGSTTTGLTYDIATTAVFTGSPQVCFNLPSVTNSTIFNNLRILHLESNIWVNRTDLASINFATKTICTSGLTSLSPFAIVNGFGPTAANVSVGGRVLAADGRGIRNVMVSISDSAGNARWVQTGSFGYYRFGEVRAGETYVMSVQSKRYQFSNPTRVVSVSDELTDVDFVSETK